MPAWTHELDIHLAPSEERTQLAKIEQQISNEYTEIKADIEDNELRYNLTFTRPFSSYLIPKDPGHLSRERRLYLERLGHVPTVSDVPQLCDEFKNELNTCSTLNSDFTSESLPLLLHAFYLKRLSILTYAKTLHSVRWKRFCRQQVQFAQVEQQFQERSARILAEFNDTLQRSQRLSSVRETILVTPTTTKTSKNTNQVVVNDDYVAYVRYLACHYRGQKYFDQLSELIRLSLFKFRTKTSNDEPKLIINLLPPVTEFPETAAANVIPKIDLEQEQTLGRLQVLIRLYSLPLDTSKIRTSGDEMELYANIMRYYRTIFLEQEKERPSIPYEKAKPKVVAQSRQSPNCILIKKSPWIHFVTMKAERDAQRERDYAKYIKGAKNDELLMRIAKFIHIKSADNGAAILKQYLLALKAKQNAALKQVLEGSATNGVQATAMADIFWKNIFDINPVTGANNEGNNGESNSDNDELHDLYDFRDSPSRSTRYMKRDEFNYLETLQKLGLDDASGQHHDSDTENNDISESYGLQLSYITLRLLRIRTLRNRCLHEFNYFRSLQRTLTIYEQRLLMSSSGKELHSIDQRFNNQTPPTYLFDTPHECTFDTLNYMQTSEHIENSEDYSHETMISNDGSIVHVQDSTGIHILYDSAFDDVNELEQEIISLGSYFIEKSYLKMKKTQQDDDYLRKVDRFEILYNLWEKESTYLQYKRKLVDCFYEIYQHTFDHDERNILAQTIVDIMARRPRIDFRKDDYFAHSYSLEINLLRQYLTLVREYMDRHITDIRQITENLFQSTDYGSFYPSTRLQGSPPIYLSVSKIFSYNLFEFLESLSSLTRLPHLLKESFNELIQIESLQCETTLSVTDQILYEIEYLNDVITNYKDLGQPGFMFSQIHQRDVFNTLFSDHPTMIGTFAYEILKQIDESRTTRKEQYDKYLKLNTTLLELVTLRYRLIRSASQCEILTNIYKQQLDMMSIDHSHLFLRSVQFEFAQSKTMSNAENDNDSEPSQLADGRLDKITGQQSLLFAIQELEESTIGRINFRQKDQWLALIEAGDEAINNLKTALRLQLMHNHLVHTAIMQHRIGIVCITQQLRMTKIDKRSDQRAKTSPMGKRRNSVAKQADQTNNISTNVIYENARRKLFRDMYFVSIQFEKTPCRDRILNEFIRQRDLKPLQYQQPREAEKLKRSLLNGFIDRIHQRNTIIILRLQIIQSYLNLSQLLSLFPITSRTHFMWPQPIPPPQLSITVSSSVDPSESVTPSPILTNVLTSNGYHHRPKMIINENCTDIANIWYIPSFTEQLSLFKSAKLNVDELEKRLRAMVRIVSSLNDLIHIVVAYAQLSSSSTAVEQKFNDQYVELSAFDQSGEFASELHEIQREIDSSPSLSVLKIADILETKRRITILQVYYSLSYLIPNSFLNGKNQSAYDFIRSRSTPILNHLINNFERYHPVYSILPYPYLSAQTISKSLYPWIVHEYQYNINSKRLWWPNYALNDRIQLSLAGLKPQELAVANSEYISTQVMLQNIDDIVRPTLVTNQMGIILRRNEVANGDHVSKYIRFEHFLVECIRLELFRNTWSKVKLNTHSLDTLKAYDDAGISFRDEIRSPVLRQLSTAVGYSSFYNDYPAALATGRLAPNVTEYECKQALIMRLLLELEGKFMMNDTLKRLKREHTLVLSERLREENSLPTDLWKKQQYTENFSVLRPHILDDLASLLADHEYKDEQKMLNINIHPIENVDHDTTVGSSIIANSQTTSEIYSIRRSDLELCLKQIGNRIMQRERDNYASYSNYYENLLHNARQILGLRENEIKSLRFQLQEQQYSVELESQLLTLSSYLDLITELIRLRSLNAQLQIDKQLRFDQQLNQIRERFQSINEQLLNTNLLLRSKFEQYREHLFNSTITIIKDIRTEIYKVARAKLTSDARSIVDEQQSQQLKLIHSLQDELHQTQEKQINDKYQRECQLRKEQVELEKTVAYLQYELDHYQKRYIYKTTKQIEEIQTLKRANNYLRKRITTNENHYKKVFENESRSETRANMEREDDLRQALHQKEFVETRLRWVQEKNEQIILKDNELMKKANEYEKQNQAMRLAQTYAKRDLVQTKKKLEQERLLKIDAFQQVETLRTNLNEIEEELEQITLNDGANSFITASAAPPPSRTLSSARAITPYQVFLSRNNRPLTSSSAYTRDKQRFTNSRLRSYSTTPTKRVQTANVHIERITPLTEEILTNLSAATPTGTSPVKMLRIKSAKT